MNSQGMERVKLKVKIEQCALTGDGKGGTKGKDRAVSTHRGWEGWN